MLSSSSVIKKGNAVENGKAEIVTEHVNKKETQLAEKNAKDFIQSYESLARTMIENARQEIDKLLSNAYDEASKIQEEAYSNAYQKGLDEGYKKGIDEANDYYEEVKKQLEGEKEELSENANNTLFKAKEYYTEYLKQKEQEIKRLIITITEDVLKKEIKNEDAISGMILDAMDISAKSKTIIVKSKSQYIEDIKEKVEIWENGNVFKGDIFVVPDDNLDEGHAVIQRENGKIVVDVMEALDKVKEIVLTESNEQ